MLYVEESYVLLVITVLNNCVWFVHDRSRPPVFMLVLFIGPSEIRQHTSSPLPDRRTNYLEMLKR